MLLSFLHVSAFINRVNEYHDAVGYPSHRPTVPVIGFPIFAGVRCDVVLASGQPPYTLGGQYNTEIVSLFTTSNLLASLPVDAQIRVHGIYSPTADTFYVYDVVDARNKRVRLDPAQLDGRILDVASISPVRVTIPTDDVNRAAELISDVTCNVVGRYVVSYEHAIIGLTWMVNSVVQWCPDMQFTSWENCK